MIAFVFCLYLLSNPSLNHALAFAFWFLSLDLHRFFPSSFYLCSLSTFFFSPTLCLRLCDKKHDIWRCLSIERLIMDSETGEEDTHEEQFHTPEDTAFSVGKRTNEAIEELVAPHKAPLSEAELARIFAAASNAPVEVQNVVTIILGVLRDALRGTDFTAVVTEAVIPSMVTSFAIQSHDGSYVSIRKALKGPSVNCTSSPSMCPRIAQCTSSASMLLIEQRGTPRELLNTAIFRNNSLPSSPPLLRKALALQYWTHRITPM